MLDPTGPPPLAPSPAVVPARPRRRWTRPSVRTLMILVLLLGGALGLVERRVHVQRAAVAAIVAGGGSVRYDWEMLADGRVAPDGWLPAPRWLVALLGPDHFGHVALATLGPRATDADLAQVGRLARLRGLIVGSRAVTDAGVAHLAGLAELEHLGLADTGVTGAALAVVRGMPRLKYLDLDGTATRDADLGPIAGLPELLELHLARTAVAGPGLAHLRGLDKLWFLGLDGTPVADAGLRHLPPLPRLALLRLTGTRAADFAAILRSHPSLQVIP